MYTSTLRTAMCCWAVGIMSGGATAIDVRMFWVPQGGDPADYPSGTSAIHAAPGDRVCVELWLQGVGVDFYAAACLATVDDRATSELGGFIQADCSTVAIDTSHPRDSGFTLSTVYVLDCGTSGTTDRLVWLRGHVHPMGEAALSTDGNYMSEVCYDVSDDAHGEFTINYIGAPDYHTIITTIYQELVDAAFDPLVIKVGLGACCLPDSCTVGGEAECDLAGGFHFVDGKECASNDCNGNGMPDECDLIVGTSQDCDDDGTPDECELDCNGNGTPDDCDIAEGSSNDCNHNTVPDECDIAGGTSRDVFPRAPRGPDGIPDECQIAEPTRAGSR